MTKNTWAQSRVPTSSGIRESSSYSRSDRRREAAATFSSRCSIEEVPGMGSMMGDRRRSQASATRSEEHTSELQSRLHLVCRLLLEKKNTHSEAHSTVTTDSTPA